MHELAVALDLVEAAERGAKAAKVRRVVVELGALTCVLPDALRFAFECAVPATALAGATLEIRIIPGRIHCPRCARDYPADKPHGLCPEGHAGIEVRAGNEVRLEEIEVV